MGKKKCKQCTTASKPSEAVPKINIWQHFQKWLSNHIYGILYIVMLAVIWTYVICNWGKCISMQFFSRFDGNNILFLVAISITILPFFKIKIEGKGIKVQAEIQKKMQTDYQFADSDYKIKLATRLLSLDNKSGKEDG